MNHIEYERPEMRWVAVYYPNRPTFYLDRWVQGIVNLDHAQRIATDVLGGDMGAECVYAIKENFDA